MLHIRQAGLVCQRLATEGATHCTYLQHEPSRSGLGTCVQQFRRDNGCTSNYEPQGMYHQVCTTAKNNRRMPTIRPQACHSSGTGQHPQSLHERFASEAQARRASVAAGGACCVQLPSVARTEVPVSISSSIRRPRGWRAAAERTVEGLGVDAAEC
jgi:hypothetical protein